MDEKKIKVIDTGKEDDKTDEETDEETKEKKNYFITVDDLENNLQLSKIIKNELFENLKYCNETWHLKQHPLWITVKEPSSIVIETINKYVDYSISSVSTQILTEKNEENKEKLRKSIEKYRKLQKSIDSSSTYSMILKHLKTQLLDKTFIEKLDNYPYFMCFTNGVFNMKTNKFTENFKQCPYITCTINYDYEEAEEEHTDFMYEVIKKICNYNNEHMHYYLSILGQSITGDAEKEKSLYFLVGLKGNNGKTLILDALAKDVMPCHASKIDRKTFEIGYSKAHKH